jgi:hypothetical protein
VKKNIGNIVRKKCEPGCVCLKHTPAPKRKCPEGCACGKHNKQRRINWDDPEVRRAYNRDMARKIREDNPERTREASRRWHARNPYYVKYRITADQWQGLFDAQQGVCYLCDDEFDTEAKRQRAIHVDHDHACCPGDRTCGKCIRGLACARCNQGIGHFYDDPDRMIKAAERLRAAHERMRASRADN